jgi:hypothetical protein
LLRAVGSSVSKGREGGGPFVRVGGFEVGGLVRGVVGGGVICRCEVCVYVRGRAVGGGGGGEPPAALSYVGRGLRGVGGVGLGTDEAGKRVGRG